MPPPLIPRKIHNKTHMVKPPVWTAKFTSGHCARCTLGIEAGQVVTRNKEGKIVHYSCVNIPTSFP